MAVFDTATACPESYYRNLNGTTDYIVAKTQLYWLSPFAQTLYIDVDTLWNQERLPEELFERLRSKSFWSGCYNVANLVTNTQALKGIYTWWWAGDFRKLRAKYGIEGDAMSQICSSMMYFEKGMAASDLFEMVNYLYLKDDTEVQQWSTGKPDEFFFNIAVAKMGMIQVPNRPMFLDGHVERPKKRWWESRKAYDKRSESFRESEFYRTYHHYYGIAFSGAGIIPYMERYYNNTVRSLSKGSGMEFLHVTKKSVLKERSKW